jgi:4-hydroxythreonine-4-phosphate dehydrogenase
MSAEKKIRVGITIGDVNGIGPEIIIKTLRNAEFTKDFIPIIYGSTRVMSFHKKAINDEFFNYHSIKDADDAVASKNNMISCWDFEVKVNLGEKSKEAGKCAFMSLERATKDLAESKIDVLVTAPICKEAIQEAGFEFPGHTEYLAHLSNEPEALMVMTSENLKVAVLTSHIPLKDVVNEVKKDKIIDKIKKFSFSLERDFGIRKPKIAVLGLNPHAGEHGKIGDEEINEINPAIQEVRNQGILAFGPYAADGFFGSGGYREFDGVLAMYHDQGLTAFKATTFGQGVNYTASLPIVRTSPDHGTGFEIAGKDKANESSFRNAIYCAMDVFKARISHKEMTADPLQAQQKEVRHRNKR